VRVRIAEAAHKEAPDMSEAATLRNALGILHDQRIDAVLSD
jgi:hypothetical protein